MKLSQECVNNSGNFTDIMMQFGVVVVEGLPQQIL